jgi:hypothetical protein
MMVRCSSVCGDNAPTGTYNGKLAVGERWGNFMSKDFLNEPHDFVAEGDRVVVLTHGSRRGRDGRERRRPDLQRRRQARLVRHVRRRGGAHPGVAK